MVTLYNRGRNLLISADQVLPRISPVVGVWAASPEEDPLADFTAQPGSLSRSAGRYAGDAVA